MVIHWSSRLIVGMAYVMLGRTELLNDMYIADDFSVEQIKCDASALAESKRLLAKWTWVRVPVILVTT